MHVAYLWVTTINYACTRIMYELQHCTHFIHTYIQTCRCICIPLCEYYDDLLIKNSLTHTQFSFVCKQLAAEHPNKE